MEQFLEQIRRFRDTREWGQFHTPKDLAISISVEAAELLEIFQWVRGDQPVDDKMVERARGEAADVFVYLLYFCDALRIDLLTAAAEKVRQNESRYTVASSFGVAGRAGIRGSR
jgi:NTP pyrophosphatase (non-canonical NTP hydrolase)